jgi:glycosyltransferase involved in cell wall biosynthesis
VVLTHNRPDLLRRCVAAAAPQVDVLLVIDNASAPPVDLDKLRADTGQRNVNLIAVPEQPPNLARLWNIGLGVARHAAGDAGSWDVALLCDDAILPDGWVHDVSWYMRFWGGAAASTHSIRPVHHPIVQTVPDSNIANRMCGWAFMLRGEAGLRADESMHWWFCDTDLDWQARAAGGMVIAPGPVVANERPNDFTYSVPGLAERAGRDREAFAAKYGSAPW